MNADIVKQTSELLVKLESSGYIDLKAAFVTKDCCGEMGIIKLSVKPIHRFCVDGM